MSNQRWRSIVEMGGIAMVVLSLLLVVFELRQNTNALRGSTFDAITEHGQFELYWSSEIAPIVVKAIQDPSQLDLVESFRLGEWLTSAMNARQNEFVQYQLGLIDERSWETLENVIQVMLGYEWAREWWSIYGTNFVNREFAAKVDELIEESTFDFAQTLEELSEIGSKR